MGRLANALLWLLLGAAVVLVVVMTWHPWVHPWTGVRR
ncbi:MAG: hypothetical protein QOJ39_2142 [Candidatus Eremiobacteraeota bacterium]|jgi:hypothetical protein|nr:hypothetical protein [Candidatus Eremiobacteraeota bacterium]MEA2720278.1 hypothetical protein [Candidatus Eremiobacteraeota bacterium]